MEFRGEGDQSDSAGAHPTERDQQQQEWWNQTPLPDDQVPSHHFGEQERNGRRPAPADSDRSLRSICSTFFSDADAANERSLSCRSTFGKQCA